FRLWKARGQEYQRVFRVRPLRAMVAGGYFAGSYDLFQRYAQPGGEHCADPRRGRQLAVVGVYLDRRRDRLLLCEAMAAERGANRPRVLRAALLGKISERRPRFSGD